MSPRQKAQIAARLECVNAERIAAVNKVPNKPAESSDRHKPGYMAEYMRKRRAKK